VSELASVLFKNLFDTELVIAPVRAQNLLGEFLMPGCSLDAHSSASHDHSLLGAHGMTPKRAVEFLRAGSFLSNEERKELEDLRQLRNKLVHGKIDHREALMPEIVHRAKELANRYGE
jgi:hypothetical protein